MEGCHSKSEGLRNSVKRYLSKDLREECGYLGEEHSEQREQLVQSP